LLNGLIPHVITGHFAGEVIIDGISTRSHNTAFFARNVSLLFQNPDFSLFNLTVMDEIEFGLKNLRYDNLTQRVAKALALVGLSGYEQRHPQTLSLGEKQKVCLACILALDTDYIVLDEPIAMLDYQSSLAIYKILKTLNNAGKTIVVIEHDTDFLWNFTDDVVALFRGKIVAHATKNTVLTDKKLMQTLGVKLPNVQVNFTT
jgi:energy-coupling factor transporter ATP-binding protein EcfA2